MTAPTLADQYEAAKERCRRLRTEIAYTDRLASMLYELVGALAEDSVFCKAVDKYLDAAVPEPHVPVTCPVCRSLGGHSMLCSQRPGLPAHAGEVMNPTTHLLETLPQSGWDDSCRKAGLR